MSDAPPQTPEETRRTPSRLASLRGPVSWWILIVVSVSAAGVFVGLVTTTAWRPVFVFAACVAPLALAMIVGSLAAVRRRMGGGHRPPARDD